MTEPYLSIIFAARNDNHCEGFMGRFQNSLNILRDLGDKHRLSFEIIIVEWNPLPDMPQLKEVLSFKKDLNSTVRIITVPYEIHKSVPGTPFDAVRADEITFFQNIALNVGARRAKGKYVICTNADVIFNEEVISFLAKRQLSNRYFYRIYRYDVQKAIPNNMTTEEILEFCRANSILRGKKVENNHLHRKAAGDFFLMAKKNYEKVRGYPEIKCDGLKIDGDILGSANRSYKQIILDDPLRIYHQWHRNRYETAYNKELHIRRSYKEVHKQAKGFNKIITQIYKIRRNCNSKNWGLIDYSLPEEQICCPKNRLP